MREGMTKPRPRNQGRGHVLHRKKKSPDLRAPLLPTREKGLGDEGSDRDRDLRPVGVKLPERVGDEGGRLDALGLQRGDAGVEPFAGPPDEGDGEAFTAELLGAREVAGPKPTMTMTFS